MPKSRKSLVKAIIECVSKGEFQSAQRLALFGRNLTGLELDIWKYHFGLKELDYAMKGEYFDPFVPWASSVKGKRDPDYVRFIRSNISASEIGLCKMFLKAVRENDSDSLFAAAKAVQFLNDKRHPVDRERMHLVWLKVKNESTGEVSTLREIAAFLHNHNSLSSSAIADGFSALRRKCKALQIAIAPSRKTSKSKTVSVLSTNKRRAYKSRHEDNSSRRRTGFSRPVSVKHPAKNRKRRLRK